MKTLIVDKTGRITRFDPVHPFFHALRKRGELVFIGSGRRPGHRGQKTGANISQTIRANGWRHNLWQLLILLPLAETAQTHFAAAHGQAAQIADFCQLELDGIPRKYMPARTVAVFFDSIARHPVTGEPEHEQEKTRFLLDRQGYINTPSAENVLFCINDLDELDRIWPLPVNLTGCTTSRGIEALPDTTKNEITRRVTKSLEKMAELVSEKKTALAGLAGLPQASPSLFLDPDRLDDVSALFSDELRSYMNRQDISVFTTYTPKQHLRSVLGRIFSLSGVLEKENITAVRVPIPGTDANRDSLIPLCYLLLALVEQGRDFSLPRRHKVLRAEVDIDWEKFRSLLAERAAVWQAAASALDRSTSDPHPASLAWQQACPGYDQFADHRCITSLSELPAAQGKQRATPASTLNEWLAEVEKCNRSFTDYWRAGQKKLAGFRHEILYHDQISQKRCQDLASEQDELVRQRERLHDKLYNAPCQDFSAALRQWNRAGASLETMGRLFYRQLPAPSTVILLIFLAALGWGTGPGILYWVEHAPPARITPAEYLIPAGFILVSLFPVLLLALASRRQRQHLHEKLESEIKATGSRLTNIFLQNTEFIYNLCQLLVTRRNLATIRAELANRQREQACRQFLRQHIHLHIKALDQLGVTAAHTGSVPEQDLSLPCHPPETNTLFSLLLDNPVSYTLNILGPERSCRSHRMPGLKQIIVTRDSDPGGGE